MLWLFRPIFKKQAALFKIIKLLKKKKQYPKFGYLLNIN